MDCEMVTKTSLILFANFDEFFINLCNNCHQTQFLNILMFARSRPGSGKLTNVSA